MFQLTIANESTRAGPGSAARGSVSTTEDPTVPHHRSLLFTSRDVTGPYQVITPSAGAASRSGQPRPSRASRMRPDEAHPAASSAVIPAAQMQAGRVISEWRTGS